MPIKWKEGIVCMVCGMALWSGSHKGHQCLPGHWCEQPPAHLPDLPHQHYRSVPPSTGVVVTDTGAVSL